MLLQPPKRYKELTKLVTQFNELSVTDFIAQIFYLQKINYVLNKTITKAELFDWINQEGEEGWQAHLASHNINSHASFFLKSIQFSQAVAKHSSNFEENVELSEYNLMQQRDVLLKEKDIAECKEQYIEMNLKIDHLAKNDRKMMGTIKKQTEILELSNDKLMAIKGKSNAKNDNYSTQQLGETQLNNVNFKFKVRGWPDPFVFRVEDRPELGLEQSLHSFEVAKYFIEDFAVFMMEFKTPEDDIEYKPLVLSQFAKQGNLQEVAKKLKNEDTAKIASVTGFYFTQLGDFCSKLIAAGVYHPDIKLTNFLAHNNRVLISDRKTLLNKAKPKAKDIRSSFFYAPDEYLECINAKGTGFNRKGATRDIEMPQFMAYQLGMALKEFLLLTQLDEPPEDDFRDQNCKLSSYFKSANKQIHNLSLLVQELTRADIQKRLSIKQFQELLLYINYNPQNFYNKLEEILPSSKLGFSEEIDVIKLLLESNIDGKELFKKANAIFNQYSESEYNETRIIRLVEQLATKCYREYSQEFFKQCSQSIETALLNSDWNKSTWYRKLAYWLTFGYFRVDRVSAVNEIDIKQNLAKDEFKLHLSLIEFLPTEEFANLGAIEAENFKDFLFLHLDDIISEENSDEEQQEESDDKEKTNEPPSLSAINASLDTGTMVVRDDVDSKLDTNASLDTGTMVVRDDVDSKLDTNAPLDTGTMVVRDDVDSKLDTSADLLTGTTVIRKNRDSKSQSNGLTFFDTSHDDAENKTTNTKKIDKATRASKTDSIRTALRRGDRGSFRFYSAANHQRTQVSEIVFEPPINSLQDNRGC